jgi:predicted CxxxxCH...CXXCH cytochrome family protein
MVALVARAPVSTLYGARHRATMARVSHRRHALVSLTGALAMAGALSNVLGACAFQPGSVDPALNEPEPPPPPPPPPNADPLLGCSKACHGDEYNTAPPRDVTGGVDTSLRGVGAHRQHLNPTPTFHRPVECSDCHVVPRAVEDPGHMDGAGAEVEFGSIASANGVVPLWTGVTCTVYCHGANLPGGALTTPTWTRVDGSQDRCGNCHGTPPPPPHPAETDCGKCHPTVALGSATFLDPDSHINGKLEVNVAEEPCDMCHGGGGNPAPPRDLDGNEDRAMPGVGAHREHVGPSPWHRELSCAQCHIIPVNVNDPGHMDGDNVAEMNFDELNPAASYNAGNATCSGLYCHGNGSNELGTRVWTEDLTLDCDSCHDDGSGSRGGGSGGPGGGDDDDRDELSAEHRRHIREDIKCSDCHASVVDASLGFVDPNLHINGVFDVSIPVQGAFDSVAKRCSDLACHGDEDW